MIAIFGLLGLAFLGGGVWAIVDGWPYMVLERGFTQVIIGTVAVTGGVILLGLCRVMMELGQVKASVSSAVAALAMANLSSSEPAQVPWPPRAAPQPMPESVAPDSLGVSPATIGLASAGAALAAGTLAADAYRTAEEPAAAPVEAFAPKIEPVEELDTRWPSRESSATLNEPGFVPFPPRTEPVDDLAALEMPPEEAVAEQPPEFDPLAAAISAALAEPPIAVATENRAFELEPVVAAEPETKPSAESSIWWPEIDASAERDQATPEPALQSDGEPASLRERLNTGPALPALSADALAMEPPPPSSDADEPATLDGAEAWMKPAFSRREPFFGEPSAEPVATEPGWPSLPVVSVPVEPEEAPSPATAPQATASSDEPEEQPAADAPPAASNEGVIGAYQVGEAHFTLFADGSIKARTPDGDYDFSSMDELKTYLASEKTRLGV